MGRKWNGHMFSDTYLEQKLPVWRKCWVLESVKIVFTMSDGLNFVKFRAEYVR